MAEYKYSGIDKTGKQAKGLVSAKDEQEALRLLRNKQIKDVSLRKEFTFSFFKRVAVKDLSAFTRQFSTLVSANLPIDESLGILTEQTEDKRLKAACESILKQVRTGVTLGNALSQHPIIFDKLYCSMVHAGEAAGVLNIVLLKLAEHIERIDKIQKKVKTSLAYPAVVAMIAVVVISALFIFVVPTFKEMFKEMDRELPFITKMVLNVSAIFKEYLPLTILALVGVYFLLRRYIKTEKGLETFTKAKLRLPIIGRMLLKASVARFSRTLATLLHAGIPLLDALKISKHSANNIIIERGIESSIKAVEIGEPFSKPLADVTIFPPLVVRMAAVGERSGNLKELLAKVADYYEEEVNAGVDSVLSVLEPIMILLLGIVIGFVLVAMYLPLFEMVTEIR